jgi:hypothetical protein
MMLARVINTPLVGLISAVVIFLVIALLMLKEFARVSTSDSRQQRMHRYDLFIIPLMILMAVIIVLRLFSL